MPQRYEDVLRPDLSGLPEEVELPHTPNPDHGAWADFDALAAETDATQRALVANLERRTAKYDWDAVVLHGDPEGPRYVDGQWL